MHNIGLVISLIVLVAMLCQWLAWRVRLPAILFLLITGMLVGPGLHWVDPDHMFGEMLMPMVSLSVAIILFEGSLTLNIDEIRSESRVVQRMITVGLLVTWVVVGVATYFIFDFPWQICALFGAVVVVTGPTVIVPMLRSVRPTKKIANILRWEGIAIDPVGALAAVMTYEFILASVDQPALSYVLWLFMQTIVVGGMIGIFSGYILGQLLSRHLIPEYLHNLATLSIVLTAFSISNALQHESGLLAVTVMGMWLANKRDVDIHHILNFKEHLSVLLISVLFVLLAARIDFALLAAIGMKAFWLLLVLQFIARPLKVWISTMGLDVSWPERGLLAWIAPRGIVAAAISAIFADQLIAIGYSDAVYLVPLTFSVIVGTVVLQSATARYVAQWLGVAEPSPRGFLIVGSNPFSRAVAKEFTKHGFRCVLADSSWENIKQARMQGLETFYGNPVSEHADLHMDMSGIGGLLGMSYQRYINVIAAIHFRADFGANRIFTLQASGDRNKTEKHIVAGSYKGEQLFEEGATYSRLVSLVKQNYEVKSTTLSESYTWEQYLANQSAGRLLLFVIDGKGQIKPFVTDKKMGPQPGHTVIALVPPVEVRQEVATIDVVGDSTVLPGTDSSSVLT